MNLLAASAPLHAQIPRWGISSHTLDDALAASGNAHDVSAEAPCEAFH